MGSSVRGVVPSMLMPNWAQRPGMTAGPGRRASPRATLAIFVVCAQSPESYGVCFEMTERCG